MSLKNSSTPNKKKTSPDQLTCMVDFISQNKVMLHGKTKPAEATNNTIEKLWDELTAMLNSIGCGPSKTKAQWKKVFIDWKCHTKKKAREYVREEQRTGGGEMESKKLTPIEEKLMALLSWVTVQGVDGNEVGFGENLRENQQEVLEDAREDGMSENPAVQIEVLHLPSTSGLSHIGNPQTQAVLLVDATIDGVELLGNGHKRRANPLFPQEIKKQVRDKTSSLQKAAKAYAIGQRHTADLVNKLLQTKTADSQEIKKKELELKELELKVRILEARNKSRELDLLERQIAIEEKKTFEFNK